MSMLRNHLATTSHHVFDASLLVLILSPCALGQFTCTDPPQAYTNGAAWTSWVSECVWTSYGWPTGTTPFAATATAASSDISDDDNDGIGAGAIAGIVIGVLLILALSLGIFFWRRKRAAWQWQQLHANKELLLGTVATSAYPTARRSAQATREMTNVAQSPQEHHDLIRSASPVNTPDDPTPSSLGNDYSFAYPQTHSQALQPQTRAGPAATGSQRQHTMSSMSYAHGIASEGNGITITPAMTTATSAAPRPASTDDTQVNIIARQKELERNYQRKEIGHLNGFSAAGSSSTWPNAISILSDSPPPYQE